MEFLAEKYFEVSIAEKFEVRVVSFSVPKAPFWVLQALVEFQVLSIKKEKKTKRIDARAALDCNSVWPERKEKGKKKGHKSPCALNDEFLLGEPAAHVSPFLTRYLQDSTAQAVSPVLRDSQRERLDQY